MGLLNYFSPSTANPSPSRAQSAGNVPDADKTTSASPAATTSAEISPLLSDVPLPESPVSQPMQSNAEPDPPKPRQRRFSLASLTRTASPSTSASRKDQKKSHDAHKSALTGAKEHEKEVEVAQARSKRVLFSKLSNSEKQAQESALIVRSLIVGPSKSSPSVTTATAKPKVKKLKSDLMKPKKANKVIAHLRNLSLSDSQAQEAHREHYSHPPSEKCPAPIHAVCLAHNDEQMQELHFAKLEKKETTTNSVEQLSFLIDEMRIVDLMMAPDLGFGQPGDGQGLLAGAVPTAETVLNGIQQITPQLMALGYATGKAILPDHKGIYPPTDRMSVLTYWWGLELVLPPPSLAYLGSAHSISNTAVNFLSAIALVNNGVREILPFVRYISQFIEFEWNTIKAQDRGDGVVCAATWIMPAALVPRSWDFAQPPTPVPAPKTPFTAIPEEDGEKENDQDNEPTADVPKTEPPQAADPPKSSSPVVPEDPPILITPAPIEPPIGDNKEQVPIIPAMPIVIPVGVA